MADLPLTRLRRRKPGELRLVCLDEGLNILIRFAVPDPIQELEIDAATDAAFSIMTKAPAIMGRYGLTQATLTQEQASMTFMRIRAIEAAVVLWKDWNVAFGAEEIDPISPETIRDVLADPNVRAAWAVFLADACSLDRAEGNVSASSPNMTTGGEATTAEDAARPTPPAAEVSPAAPASTAPPSRSPRKRRKGSLPAGSEAPQA